MTNGNKVQNRWVVSSCVVRNRPATAIAGGASPAAADDDTGMTSAVFGMSLSSLDPSSNIDGSVVAGTAMQGSPSKVFGSSHPAHGSSGGVGVGGAANLTAGSQVGTGARANPAVSTVETSSSVVSGTIRATEMYPDAEQGWYGGGRGLPDVEGGQSKLTVGQHAGSSAAAQTGKRPMAPPVEAPAIAYWNNGIEGPPSRASDQPRPGADSSSGNSDLISLEPFGSVSAAMRPNEGQQAQRRAGPGGPKAVGLDGETQPRLNQQTTAAAWAPVEGPVSQGAGAMELTPPEASLAITPQACSCCDSEPIAIPVVHICVWCGVE